MNINVVRRIPFGELEKKLRQVPLLHTKDANGAPLFVYSDAKITFRTVFPDELNPTTYYLLKKNLAFQRDLRAHLIDTEAIDPFALSEAVELENTDTREVWTLTPPIIEVSEERVSFHGKEGDICYEDQFRVKLLVINDGAHRAYLARELNVPVTIVHIHGVDSRYPFYALPNGWERVRVVSEVPKTMAEKKAYRRTDSYELYRNFGVLGLGAPRRTGS